MAETPKFYMPDLKMLWKPLDITTSWGTDQVKYLGGRRQRRGRQNQKIRAYKLMNANVLSQENRRAFYDFFNTVAQGALNSFYFWEPSPRTFVSISPPPVWGTNFAGSTYSQPMPWKGAYWLGDTPITATYANGTYGAPYLINSAGPSIINSIMACPPRGNRYCTYLFNGINQYANAGAATQTRIASDQAWAAWVFVRANDVGAAHSYVIASNRIINASGAILFIDTNRNIRFGTHQAGANTTAISTGVVPLNTWTFVVASYNSLTKIVTFFINNQQDSTTSGINAPVTATANLTLGIDQTSGGTGFWHGMLNDVQIYSTQLSLSQVQLLYADSAHNLQTSALSCVGLWHITEGRTATSLIDSINGNNASLVSPSDDSWVGGEDEVDDGSFTGQVTFTTLQNARQRVCVTFAADDLPESFLADVVPVNANFDIALLEAP